MHTHVVYASLFSGRWMGFHMSGFVFRAEGSRISDPKPDAGVHLHTLPFALKNSLTVDWKVLNLFVSWL